LKTVFTNVNITQKTNLWWGLCCDYFLAFAFEMIDFSNMDEHGKQSSADLELSGTMDRYFIYMVYQSRHSVFTLYQPSDLVVTIAIADLLQKYSHELSIFTPRYPTTEV
jgi:hypothetical protein